MCFVAPGETPALGRVRKEDLGILRLAWAIQQVLSQPGLHNEILSQKLNQTKNKGNCGEGDTYSFLGNWEITEHDIILEFKHNWFLSLEKCLKWSVTFKN
jgi:hypothetical protein